MSLIICSILLLSLLLLIVHSQSLCHLEIDPITFAAVNASCTDRIQSVWDVQNTSIHKTILPIRCIIPVVGYPVKQCQQQPGYTITCMPMFHVANRHAYHHPHFYSLSDALPWYLDPDSASQKTILSGKIFMTDNKTDTLHYFECDANDEQSQVAIRFSKTEGQSYLEPVEIILILPDNSVRYSVLLVLVFGVLAVFVAAIALCICWERKSGNSKTTKKSPSLPFVAKTEPPDTFHTSATDPPGLVNQLSNIFRQRPSVNKSE